jgi:two-component system phosphate regulon sensor histidine kinase PhoR
MPTRPTAEFISAYPHAAVLIDWESRVTATNQRAVALFPLIREGFPISFAIRDPAVLAAIAETRADGVARGLEVVERVPVERAVQVHAARIGGNDVLVVFDDLTAGRRLERMRVDFVANASHELRTPLASLLGFIETIRGPARNDDAARERFLGIMEDQGRRMARLVDDLLSLSRIELNAHIQPNDPVDLSGVVRQIVDALRPLAVERGLEIMIDIAQENTMVAGDRDELLRVFENLIENAIKYGASGKRIELSLKPEPAGHYTVTVRDHGPGVAPEHLPRLTERFYRVDAVASREAGGTGLGLAIVKHIVARHRGRFDIDSELGKGSKFMVTLSAIDR